MESPEEICCAGFSRMERNCRTRKASLKTWSARCCNLNLSARTGKRDVKRWFNSSTDMWITGAISSRVYPSSFVNVVLVRVISSVSCSSNGFVDLVK